MTEQHWLIWDGECGFCRKSTAWVGRHDRARRFHPVPFQSCPSPPMTPALRDAAQRAVQVITVDGRRFEAGRAILFILEEIDWHPRLARLARLRPLIWLVEIGYRIVARNRPFFSRFFCRGEP